MDVGGESAFSSDSVEHASTENHVSRSTASLRQGKPPNTGVDAYQGPISHSLLYKVGVKDKRARAASIELQSVRSRSNSSKPFSWNHTTSRSTTEGSSASSEASVIVIDNAHKMKSRNKTLCDSVVVPTFKPDPNEEYLINFSEFEINSLKRITAPAGRVIYEVHYQDGHVVELSPAEIYNHIDPDEVERLENAYFELDLNAETIYDEDDPDYPAGAPSGGTYALERAQAVALEKINKRRKDPPEVAEASQLPETSLRRKPGRPRKNVNTSRDMLSPDAGSISSSSVSSGPAVAHNPVAATPSGVPAPNDCMEIDHWIDTEVTAQPFQEHSTLSSANNSPRGFIPFASHRSNEGGNALSPSNPNYVAPFDDERDGDFLPNSKSPNKRPVKRSKPSPSNRKPSNSKSSPSGNKNPSLSPFIAPSFLKPEAKKSGPTFQVPITSLFKSLGNTPNVSPAVKPAAKSKKTIMVPPPISSPKAIPSLAMVGASPTEPSRSLFPPPPPIAPVRNKKSKRPWSPTPKARNLQSNGGVTAKNFKTKSGKIFSNSSSSQFSEWDSIDEVSDLPTKDTPPLGICSDSKQVQRKSRTPVSGRRKKSTPPPLATSYYDVDLDELQEPVEPEEYSVESILAYKREAGEIFYLVKWLGYDEPTWEADENLENSRELVEEFQRTRLRGG